MKIINFLICCFLFVTCTNKFTQSGFSTCSIVQRSYEKKYFVFENWYKEDVFACSINWHLMKDINGSRKGNLKNGLQDGKWVVEKYHDYDSVGYSKSKRYLGREEYFRNGLRDSIYKIYNHEGKVIYSTNFKKGNGIEKDFYDNGQLYYEIETKDGYFTDTLRLYKKNGQLMQKLLYRKDSLIFKKDY